MTFSLQQNTAIALRNAPPSQQKRILAILENWPDRVGQSRASYLKVLRQSVKRLVNAWGGVWLNPDEKAHHLQLQCAQGHLWRCPWVIYLRRGRWCPTCTALENQKKILTEIKKIAEQHGGECLTEHYTPDEKLSFRCNHGHTWQTKGRQVKNAGSWCPTCSVEKSRHPLAYLHALAAEQGGLCLANEHTSTSNQVKWQCAKGHIWKASPNQIRSGCWCPQCSFDKKRLTIEEMREIAKSRGGQCLSKHYKNAATKLLWECKLGHRWEATPNNIKSGKWCSQCVYLARSKYEKSRQKYLPDKRKILMVGKRKKKQPVM